MNLAAAGQQARQRVYKEAAAVLQRSCHLELVDWKINKSSVLSFPATTWQAVTESLARSVIGGGSRCTAVTVTTSVATMAAPCGPALVCPMTSAPAQTAVASTGTALNVAVLVTHSRKTGLSALANA